MLPVLYRFVFETDFSKALLYLVALGLVAYSAMNGWRNAGGVDAKGNPVEPTPDERRNRAITYGLVGVALAGFGLYYALPNVPVIGRGKGEGIPIHTYGVMIGLGFITATTVISWLALREWPGKEGVERSLQMYDLAFYCFVGGIIGSRVLFVMVNWKDYAADPVKIFSLGGGLVFYGGLIGATIGSIIFARRNGIEFLRLADLAIPTVSLGQAFGRLGCFSAGCCWGDVTTHAKAPFAVEFPGTQAMNLFGGAGGTPSLAYSSMVDASNETRWVVESTGQVSAQAVDGAVRISDWVVQHGHTLPIHPTQLYESFGQMVLFGVLMTARRWRRFHGQIFAMWLMCYAVLRTSVELFRGDLERGTIHGLIPSIPTGAWYNISTSQFISIAMFSFGSYLLAKNLREVKARPAVDLTALTAA
ncbi:MAG: prolipoprotein diacylglyceryl transferase [Archangium sp.]|nr:prolipoprotein diacylglyceryl transferase [Archangium sp.]MDP3572445.1 prolipoprotein diacylglyceryl transferase [Archangium sp.]